MSKKYSFSLGWIIPINLALSLSGCNNTTPTQLAPVTEGWQQAKNAQAAHRVEKGETLYSIAWRFGLDYRNLAAINHIQPPYAIHVGQKLYLNTPMSNKSTYAIANKVQSTTPIVATNTPIKTAATEQATKPVVAKADNVNKNPVNGWIWPTNGKILNGYQSSDGMNKGIDLTGNLGQPIKASAAGKVVYCGSGLRGYGNLIIIKHNDEFLSAYAHNQKLLVHEGQSVKTGEVIATMGDSEAKRTMLHFEIRRAGKPIDPLSFLPARQQA